MAKLAFLFPGQGAQVAGMGKDFAAASPAAQRVYDEARKILGWDVAAVCFNGPQSELDRTSISQPAILTTSLAIMVAMEEAELPQVAEYTGAAGLSLGEYSALVAAKAFTFEDALRLVQKRGQFMEEACIQNPGAMASILGLENDIIEAICAEARAVGMVVAANFNSPGQVVISGTKEAVARAGELAKEHGAKRVLPLAVSGAFHSPLMAPAAEKLEAELQNVEISAPAITLVANVSAEPAMDPDVIRISLARQVKSAVLWSQSVQRLVDEGYTSFVEVGPGKVLSGLMKRIAPDATCVNVSTMDALNALKK